MNLMTYYKQYNIPEQSTIYSLFEEKAEENKGKVCLKVDGKKITFKEFRAFAERIDSKIRSITKEEKSVIAVICERSFEMYGAVYGIIRGGNAYLPIDPNYPQDRIDYILQNSNAKAVVAQDKFCHLAGNVPCIDATDILNSNETIIPTEILANENDTAYVIYTSGSTGNPKGAKISHKSAVNRILWMDEFYPLEENDVILQKTPYTFDVSVWELFWWGMKGRTLCASKPDEHFLPAKILEETEKNKVTHLHFVPSVFDIFLTYLENNPEEQKKFESVKYVFLSGEALTANSIKRFYNIYDYNKVQLHNLYGPTECAVDVSYYACKPTDEDPVPIGKPIYNTQLYIVDKYMNPTPVGVVGELCIGGVNVGQGYLNNEELTKEKFIDNPFHEGKIYRTGDLAYFRKDGEIIFCGRMDHQIKLNGQRIELGEIENAITTVDGVVQCAVVVRKDNDNIQHICAFYTGTEINVKNLRTVLSSKLPRYMVPHAFMHIEEMPLTSSGKINRNNLPEIDLNNLSTETDFIAPTTQKEKVLAEVLSSVLSADNINMLDNFFNVGGDSITAIYVVSELEDKGYELLVSDIMQSDTLLDIVSFMQAIADTGNYEDMFADFVSLDATEEELTEINELYDSVEYIYNLTPSQEGMYAQYFQNTDTKTYQLENLSRITKETDIPTLKTSVELLSLRHPVLNSAFTVLKSGAIKQVILENRKPRFNVIEKNEAFSQAVLDSLVNEATEKAFDLQKDSLFRVTIIDFTDARFMLMHAHHIVMDGWCLPILITDLQKYYGKLVAGMSIEELTTEINNEVSSNTSYAQYVNWIKNQDTNAISAYWKNLLDDCDLAHIFGKEKKDNLKNEDIISFTSPLSNELSLNIEQFAKESKVSPNTVFECAFSIALQKYSNSEDVVFDKIISGRSIPVKNIENTVGLFINTVPVRIKTEENSTLADLLKETQNQTINANVNGILPLAEIYKASSIDAKSVDALFVFENYFTGDISDIQNGPLSPKAVSFDEQTEFNLTVTIMKENNSYSIRTSYANEMYSEREIQSFVNGFISILSSLDENKQIKDISAITEEEKEQINSFNETEYTYDIPSNTTLYSLFENQATKNEDKVCIIANEEEITYKDFRSFAERIDNQIRAITKEEKSVIAVICERSFEMYGAVYGIIRGGNAYLPIDPNYPQDRIDYILQNSNSKAVVTQDKFCHLAGNVPCINATEVLSNKENVEQTKILANENDTAYVIYTSGSTGNPKGAKISHKSAINRILWMHDFYPLEENDVILQKTPYTFDVSVWELFWWGITGRTLCAAKPDEHFLPAKILNETENHKVTHLHFVPSVFDLFLTYLENNKDEQEKFNSVKYVFLSGEALTANHINRFYNIYDYNKVSLHNLYGPTECAVDVSYYPCAPTDTDPVPIGKPIYNTQLHIVDKYLIPTPIGVVGELCIAGVNVGQGYLNNEQLTNEKFIDNPFGDGKLYKTGDLAYWTPNGQICYVGRMDNQIKLNGQRIELGEIENAISEIDGVLLCAVIVKEQHICAFYTGEEIDAKDLRSILSAKLPRYMVPSVFTHLDEMPLTSSGKINRKGLPDIDFDGISTDAEFVAPTTQKEIALTKVLSSVLSADNINMLDNFFNIGGDSITAIHVVSELEDLGYELLVSDIMQSDSIADIANAMKSTANMDNYDQNEVDAFIPFSPIMRAYLNERSDIAKDFVHNCIISADCNEEIAKKAFDVLISHHDILRGTFTDDGIVILPTSERNTYSFKVADVKEAIENTTLDEDKLVKVVFYKSEKESLISITVHHFLIDLVSWEVLMKDFTTVVNQLKKGEKTHLSAKSASFKLWNEELQKYSETMPEENKEYWNSINQQLQNVSSICLNEDENEAEKFSFSFSKDVSGKLVNEVNTTYSTRINEILVTALGLAAGKIANGAVGIMIESHGRAPLHKRIAIERTVGWFTSCYPVIVNNAGNISEEIVNTKEALRRIPKNGIEYLLLFNGLHKNTDIIFNFYKNSVSNENRENKLVAFNAETSIFPGKINVNCFITDDILTIEITVPKSNHPLGISETLGQEFITQIYSLVDFCTTTDTVIKTRSDFTDDTLTQSELDELTELFDWGDDDEE